MIQARQSTHFENLHWSKNLDDYFHKRQRIHRESGRLLLSWPCRCFSSFIRRIAILLIFLKGRVLHVLPMIGTLMPASSDGFDRTFIVTCPSRCSFLVSVRFHDFAEACVQGGFYSASCWLSLIYWLWSIDSSAEQSTTRRFLGLLPISHVSLSRGFVFQDRDRLPSRSFLLLLFLLDFVHQSLYFSRGLIHTLF